MRAGPGRAYQGDGHAAGPADLGRLHDRAMGLGRGAERPAGFHPEEPQRSSRSGAISSSRCSTRRKYLKCPSPEGAFYVYPSCAERDRQSAGRQGHRERRGFLQCAARSRGRCGGARLGLRQRTELPHLLCDVERAARGCLPQNPAFLRQPELIVKVAWSRGCEARPLRSPPSDESIVTQGARHPRE